MGKFIRKSKKLGLYKDSDWSSWNRAIPWIPWAKRKQYISKNTCMAHFGAPIIWIGHAQPFLLLTSSLLISANGNAQAAPHAPDALAKFFLLGWFIRRPRGSAMAAASNRSNNRWNNLFKIGYPMILGSWAGPTPCTYILGILNDIYHPWYKSYFKGLGKLHNVVHDTWPRCWNQVM
jgi:hypothetical protein